MRTAMRPLYALRLAQHRPTWSNEAISALSLRLTARAGYAHAVRHLRKLRLMTWG